MIRVFRWLLNITTGLILLGLATLALIYYFASRSLPDYDGTSTVAGLTAPVEIVRDNANVPHIFGGNDADVFFALGYAHGQDRMWQMLVTRRMAQGYMSEVFGQSTVESDILVRRLDLYGLATRDVAAQDAETQEALIAYSAGVNAWLAEVNEGARGRGAPEMWLFDMPVAFWQPADSLAILKLMALQQSPHLTEEVLRARVNLLIGPDRLSDLMPDAPGTVIAALPDYAALIPDVPAFTQTARADPGPLFPVAPRRMGGASNAWAAAPERAASGATLLANDPHVNLTAPSTFYLARLELASGGVIGATIPGMPLIVSGRSADLGWGVTASYLDDQDIYIEEVNPANTDQYRIEGGVWEDFRTRSTIINIADAPGISVRMQWSRNGPVLPPEAFDLSTIRPQGHVTTLRWTALEPGDTSMSAGLALMRSHDVTEALGVTQGFVAPSQNLVLADRNRIAMVTVGAAPARDPGNYTQGRMPVLGYIPENRWTGIRPASTNPRFVDPPGGLVGNTNNKVTDRPFPDHISYFWGDTARVQRWEFLMQGREVHNRDSFIDAQLDTVSVTARSLLPLVGADLWYTGDAAPEGTPERQRQRALALLADWNGEMNEHLPEPLIYAAWMMFLQERLIRDELGPLAREFTNVEPVFIARVFRNVDGAAVWCDVLQSAPVETCTDIARASLDAALIWITETYGGKLESLRWGNAHEALQDHPVLGNTPFFSWFVNIRQSTSGGDDTLMRGLTAGAGASRPFANVNGAGYRGVYDFADPDSSVFIISTGQSGHPLSRYYDDMGELWRRGEYVPMSLDPGLARAGAVGVTTLLPAGDSGSD